MWLEWIEDEIKADLEFRKNQARIELLFDLALNDFPSMLLFGFTIKIFM